jgi:D-amino-acid dehydrogenase
LEKGAILVIGAGVVGLAVAYHLVEQGAVVTVIDKDPEGDKASFGNAGGIAVTEVVPASTPGIIWRAPRFLLDPLGPLAIRPSHALNLLPWLWRFVRAGAPEEVARVSAALSALNRRVYDDLLPMLRRTGLAGELHQKGALTVYETEAGFRHDADEWSLKRAHGVATDVIDGDGARHLEPALGSNIRRAVFTPQWSHVNDPKRLVDGLRRWLQSAGVTIMSGSVEEIVPSGQDGPSARLRDGRKVQADAVVVAAGVWSGLIAKTLGDPALLESERGYNATLPNPGIALEREIIFAEKKFVATPLSCGLRVGGAAEFGGLDAAANYRRSETLLSLASRYLPGLRTSGAMNWAGHRPATPDSLPVIGPSVAHPNVFYAFGHGHLGLTQAATTGRLVADLISNRPSSIDLSPYAISRFR